MLIPLFQKTSAIAVATLVHPLGLFLVIMVPQVSVLIKHFQILTIKDLLILVGRHGLMFNCKILKDTCRSALLKMFEVALKEFMSKAPENLLAIKDGIDSYHWCCEKAQYTSQLLTSI